MKALLMLFLVFSITAKSQILETVGAIASYSNPYAQMVVVKDSLRGGQFYQYAGTDATDNGMIFTDALSRKWKRTIPAHTGVINAQWYGASSVAADNRSYIIAAYNYISTHDKYSVLKIPKGVYQLSDSIRFDKNISILGDGVIGYPQTELVFPAGKNGLVFAYNNGGNGFGADVENISITGQLSGGYAVTNKHAIIIRTRVKMTNVVINQFDGNGFHVSACAIQPNGDNNNYGNADQSVFINCSATYCTNGFFTEGCDAQVNSITDCNFSQNRRWGYFGNAFVGDKLDNVHFAFDGVAIPGAKSVVTYDNKYWVARSGYDGYFGDATDSNYNKQPDINPDYWLEVTPPMVEYGAWSNNTRYYSGGPAIVKTVNAWTTFHHCYTEAFQPPVILNSRSRWEYGTNGSGAVGGIVKNTLYGEEHTYNGGTVNEKYAMIGTTTYDPSTVLKSYNDYSKTQSRVVFKGEGTTTDVYLDLKNNTGKSARINYSINDLRIYTKDDSLGLTINDAGITAKKYFGDGSALTGVTGSGAAWGQITGTLSNQTDLQAALDGKQAAGTYATGSGSATGTNTGDNATNTQYSGLVSNATHTGDATGSTALTLATVNSNVGSFTNANITVNGKGLITAASNGSAGGSPAWGDITGKPTTISGYGITDYLEYGETNVTYKTDFLAAATTANPPYVGTAISSGTNAANTTNLNGNRPGIVRMTSSTTANGGYRWVSDAAPIRIKGDEIFMCGIAPVNFTTTTMRAGFLDNTTSADAVDGIYFQYSANGDVVLKTSNNSTRTTSATITTLSLNTWYKLKITVNSNATSVLGEVFDAAGTLISSQTITTNIPTAAGRETGVGIVCTESTTTATAMCDLDFIYTKFVLTR